MNYNGFMPNDFINGEDVCVSLWTQGCPFRCEGCSNPQTWDENGGVAVPSDLTGRLIKAISANDIQRNFSILGGEPLADWNLEFVQDIITKVRIAYPHIKIYLWTGYTYDFLIALNSPIINEILDKIDVLIDGPFILDKRDITLKLRGSSNQHIRRKNEKKEWVIVDE